MFKILPYNMLYSNISIMYILCLHGHPNQSGHITSSTAKCLVDANSGGPDNHNMIQKTHLYQHCWSLNNTCPSGCEVC